MTDKKSTTDTTGADTQADGAQRKLADAYRKPKPRVWAKPYKLHFVCDRPPFEMGEDRKTNERKFIFREGADAETVALLRAHGFVYRPADNAWIITATRTSRIVCDELARQFAGLTGRVPPAGY